MERTDYRPSWIERWSPTLITVGAIIAGVISFFMLWPNERIAILEKEVESLQKITYPEFYEHLEKQALVYEQKISTHKATIESLTQEIEAFNAEIKSLSGEVSALLAERERLNQEIKKLDGQVMRGINTRIDARGF